MGAANMTQRRLCERFAAPVIDAVTCQDITISHTQKIVNAASHRGEGDRLHRMLSAIVGAGIKGKPGAAAAHQTSGEFFTWALNFTLRHIFIVSQRANTRRYARPSMHGRRSRSPPRIGRSGRSPGCRQRLLMPM